MRHGSWQVVGVEDLQHLELWEEAVGMQDSSYGEEGAAAPQARGFDWEVLEGQTPCVLLGTAEEQGDAMCFLPPGFSGVAAGVEAQGLLLKLPVADWAEGRVRLQIYLHLQWAAELGISAGEETVHGEALKVQVQVQRAETAQEVPPPGLQCELFVTEVVVEEHLVDRSHRYFGDLSYSSLEAQLEVVGAELFLFFAPQ